MKKQFDGPKHERWQELVGEHPDRTDAPPQSGRSAPWDARLWETKYSTHEFWLVTKESSWGQKVFLKMSFQWKGAVGEGGRRDI